MYFWKLESRFSYSFPFWQVHAYERINRLYKYKYDPCGPVYITVGDGGNHEKLAVQHADEENLCPIPTKTPDKNFEHLSGFCGFNFTNGKFCWDKQPDWSAWRDSSFGHGIIEVLNNFSCFHESSNLCTLPSSSVMLTILIKELKKLSSRGQHL